MAVEWVKSCYSSLWRLSDDSAVLTPGRYIFAPDDTPFYPGFHDLGSRIWTTDDFPHGDPTHGEVRHTRQKWYNGLAPQPFPVAEALNDPSQESVSLDNGCLSGWIFTQENGADWTYNGNDPLITFENSLQCGGTNLLRQFGTGTATLRLVETTAITGRIQGRVERHNAGFDVGEIKVNGNLLVHVEGVNDLLGCVMLDVDESATVTLPPGSYPVEISGDTIDQNWHQDVFFQFALTFNPPLGQSQGNWINGFPEACFLPRQPAEIELLEQTPDIFDPRSNFILCNICRELYDDDTVALASLLSYLGPNAVGVSVPNSSSPIPGTVIAYRDDICVVVIAGTTNVLQAVTYTTYAGIGPSNYGNYSTNDVWRAAANVVEQRVTDLGVPPGVRIVLAGHSYGGAIAGLMAADYKFWRPDRQVDVCTWGGAKPGDDRLAEIVAPCRVVRVANDGDPVPGLPPAYAQILGYLLSLPGVYVNAWTPFVQPRGQVILSGLGEPTWAESSTLDLIYLAQVVAQVLGGPDAPFPFAHSISEYARRISIWASSSPG